VKAIKKIDSFQSAKLECIDALQQRVSEYDQLWLPVNVEKKKQRLNDCIKKIQPLASAAYSEFINILDELLNDPVMELKTGVTGLAQKALGIFSNDSANLLPESGIKRKVNSILIELKRDYSLFVENDVKYQV